MPLASDARRKVIKGRKGRKGRMGCTLHEHNNTRFLFPSVCELQIGIFCIYNHLPSRVAVVLSSRLLTQALNCRRRTPKGFALCRHIHAAVTLSTKLHCYARLVRSLVTLVFSPLLH